MREKNRSTPLLYSRCLMRRELKKHCVTVEYVVSYVCSEKDPPSSER